MHNLTYQERARFAYAAGNTELAEALEELAEQEAIIERLDSLCEDMLDVLHEVLPYMEVVAEEDQGYKAGAVAKVVRNIQAVIKATEES
jgi:hypothetical protein